MNFLNSIYYKSLSALYNLNVDRNGNTKSFLVDAIFKALVIGKDGLDDSKLEMALLTASGDWLNFWGATFGIYRIYGESDDDYRKRIIEEVIALKDTIPALKQATSHYLDVYKNVKIDPTDINIFEPWTELLVLNTRGTLNGDARLMSEDYWRYAVIDISLPNSELITPDLIEYLSTKKAAGVRIKFSIAPIFGIIKDPDWEEKRYHIWNFIHQQRYITPINEDDVFRLAPDEYDGKIEDSSISKLNGTHKLCGSGQVFWNGIEFTREYYATGVIRDYRKSATIGFKSAERKLNKDMEDITIDEFIELEKESLNGTRDNEGYLSITQGPIEIVTDINYKNKYYLAYTTRDTNEDYVFGKDLLRDYITLEQIESLNMTVEEFYQELYTVESKSDKAKEIRKFELDLINKTNLNQSIQNPIEITTESI